jgi:adenylylsulfate kinase
MTQRNLTPYQSQIDRAARASAYGHRSAVIWLTGLSGAGKSTLAHALEHRLHRGGCKVYVLDGDNVRHGLCADLGFSLPDRSENIRRVGEAARLFVDAGLIVITAFISPLRADRDAVRAKFAEGDFLEVFCSASLPVCEERDVKGLYQRARSGEVPDFTGVSSPYEEPESPEHVAGTGDKPLRDCVNELVEMLEGRGIVSTETLRV